MGKQKDYIVDTLDNARVSARKFIEERVGGLAFGFVTDLEGMLTVHERWQQPCYGEMRPYGVTHKDMIPEGQRSVRKPGDLTTPFPDKGNPVIAFLALSRDFTGHDEKSRAAWKDFINVILNPETSPWRSVLKDIEVVTGKNDVPVGVIYNDTHFPPTVLVNLWMFIRNQTNSMNAWAKLREVYVDKDPNLLLLWFAGMNLTSYDPVTGKSLGGEECLAFSWLGDYYLTQQLVAENFLQGRPIIDEPTFFERGAYDRPNLHNVFGKKSTSFAAQFKKAFGVAGHQSVVIKEPDYTRAFEVLQSSIA